MLILQHLENLADYFTNKTNEKIPYINIYSRPSGNKYVPVYAKNEGKACVDDVSRAIVLAFEIYEFTKDPKALDIGLNWVKFLDYMTDDKGHIFNFIDINNNRVNNTKSSFPGGAWWTSRAKHTYSKAYKITKDRAYLKKYFNLTIKENFDTDIDAMLFIAGFEIKDRENKTHLRNLADKICSTISPSGYLIHNIKDRETHMWGYHQLEAMIKAFCLFKEKKYLDVFDKSIEQIARDEVKNNFYYSYPSRTKEGLCAYCISPICKGLFEAYENTRNKKYKTLFMKCSEWFNKTNDFGEIIYNKSTGTCRDGIKNGKLSNNCGAESSIEAGYVEIRKLILNNSCPPVTNG